MTPAERDQKVNDIMAHLRKNRPWYDDVIFHQFAAGAMLMKPPSARAEFLRDKTRWLVWFDHWIEGYDR